MISNTVLCPVPAGVWVMDLPGVCHRTGICGRAVCCGQGPCNDAVGWHYKARGKHGPDITTSRGGDWKLLEFLNLKLLRFFWFC